MRDTSNDESDAPMIIDNNITMITNQQQLDKSREERNRKKARTLSVEETNKQIGITTIEYPVSDDDEDNNENVG
jgi:TPP-dependent indolepyruvate ferredoxin oxidoreductase alpha subunit